MKTIIVQIEADDGQEARLQAAFDLVRAFEGHLVCLQVTPYAAYAMGDPATGGFDSLFHSLGNFDALAVAVADFAPTITHHHQRGKAESASALDGGGGAIDRQGRRFDMR